MTVVDEGVEAALGVTRGLDAPGYHQCWYPVALSTELEEHPLLGKPFLGGRVIVYRKADGDPVVLSAYCAHVGADLAVGELEGEEVRCAFHHFRYGPDGRCTSVPFDNKIPDGAQLFAYPAVERFGVVWAFNGETPLYDPPAYRDYGADQLVWRSRTTMPFPVEPWVLITNSYDFLHLRVVHGMVFDFDPQDIRMPNPYVHEYELTFEMPGIGTMDQRIRTLGTNTVALTATVPGVGDSMAMFSATPLPDGTTATYSIAATPDTRDGTPEEEQAIEGRLLMQEMFADSLLADDTPILSTIRFREGTLLPGDRMLGRYLRFVRQYPRQDAAAAYR